MGIKGLVKFIAKHVPGAVEQVADPRAKFRGARVAVDIMMLLYRLVASGDKYLEEEARYRFRTFMDAGMEAILIQDGPPRTYKTEYEHGRRNEAKAEQKARLVQLREEVKRFRECAAALVQPPPPPHAQPASPLGSPSAADAATAASGFSFALPGTGEGGSMFDAADAAAAAAMSRASSGPGDAAAGAEAGAGAGASADATTLGSTQGSGYEAAAVARAVAAHDDICIAMALKEGDEKRAAKADLSPTAEHLRRVLDVAADMGIRIVVAQHDGEELAAVMAAVGDVDYVITEDQDALPFGAPAMLRAWWDSGASASTAASYGGGEQEKLPVIVHLERALSGLDLTMPQFRDFCILCGCDFGAHLPYVGATTAYKMMRRYGSLDAAVDALEDWARGRLCKRDVFLCGPDDKLPSLQQVLEFRKSVPKAREVFSLANSGYDEFLRDQLAAGRVPHEPAEAWEERRAAMQLALGGAPRRDVWERQGLAPPPPTDLGSRGSTASSSRCRARASTKAKAKGKSQSSMKTKTKTKTKASGGARATERAPAAVPRREPPAPLPVSLGPTPLDAMLPALLALERNLRSPLKASKQLAVTKYCAAHALASARDVQRHVQELQQLLERCDGDMRARWRQPLQDEVLPALHAAAQAMPQA